MEDSLTRLRVTLMTASFFADGHACPSIGGIGVAPSARVVKQFVTWNGLLSPSVMSMTCLSPSDADFLLKTFCRRFLFWSHPISSILYKLDPVCKICDFKKCTILRKNP